MLRNTLYKLTAEKKLTLGFFGGSITDGTGSTDEENKSYRALVTRWFRETYPDADIVSINASIGGTGTGYGMFRCDRDLLKYDPDLIFIEFCLNDFGDTYENVLPHAEAIVRKIRKTRPCVDIIAVASADQEVEELVGSGREYESKEAMFAVAHRYSVPTANAGAALVFRVLRDGGDWNAYVPDGLHPSDLGHSVMALSIESVISELIEKSAKVDAPEAHALPGPICPDVLDGARMTEARDIKGLTLDGFRIERSTGRRFDERIIANRIGASFSFDFEGPVLGFIWDDGIVSGDLSVSVDGGEPTEVRSWDHYVRSFQKMQAALFMTGLDPTVPHRATATVTHLYGAEGTPDGAVQIGAILTA